MNAYELAIDQDGEPFTVPPDVTGWRVRRGGEGRGRPELLYKNGKPLIVRANASHADLLAAAGPGKYRLDPVDALGHVVAEVPVACTGPLRENEGASSASSSDGEVVPGGSVARQIASYEEVICQVVSANTRMVEKALGQLGTVMSGVAELLHAAHNAGITSRVPPPPPPPPATPPPVESDEDDDEEEADRPDDEQPEEAAPKSGIPEVLQLLIKETVDKVVPLIFEKITEKIASGSGLGGLPLAAIFDWRKAVPNPAEPSAPAADPGVPPASVAPSAPAAPAAPSVPPAPSARPPASVPSSFEGTGSTPIPPAPAPAGAASSPLSPLGVAPAETAPPPGASSPRTHEEATALINAHILQVWQGLSPPERARATQLIARLTPDERTAWLADLTNRTVPDAIARARAVIHAQPPTPATPQLPTATPHGDPS